MKMLKNLFASLLFTVLTFTATAQTTQTVNIDVSTNGSVVSVTSCVIDFHASGGYLSSVKIWRTSHTYHVYSVTDFTLSPTDFYYTVQPNDSAYKVYITNSTNSGSAYVSGSITYSCNGTTTGIESIKYTTTKLSVFPNPSTDEVSITFNTNKEKTPIEVFDVNGRLVMTDDTTREIGQNTTKVNISNFSQGIYIVRVGSEIFKITKI